jgi:hypothetical protein
MRRMTDDVEINAVEQEARQFGWVPEEDFKGNKDEWRSAEDFLKRGREINGFLRKDMEKLNSKLAQKDAELAEIKATIEEFKKYHNETESRAYKRAIDDLKQQKIEAIQSGDGERVVEIDEQIDQYKEAQRTSTVKTEPAKKQEPVLNEFDEWVLDNKWFVTNQEAKYLAELYGKELTVRNPEIKGRAFLDAVSKKVKEEHPDLFENPARSSGAVSTSSDGRKPGGKSKRSYNDLPPEAKAACDRFVKEGLLTQDKYVSEYEWD